MVALAQAALDPAEPPEPHSLTPCLPERAVRWGAMRAPEALADLTKAGRDPDMVRWLTEGRCESCRFCRDWALAKPGNFRWHPTGERA